MSKHYFQINYPNRDKPSDDAVEISLCDIRAADNIRVWYDFDRDGWVIEQPSISSWPAGDTVCDEGWTEAAFCPAWQFDQHH